MENKIEKLIEVYREELKEHEKRLMEIFLDKDKAVQLACINCIEEFIEDLEEIKRYYNDEE